MSVSKFEAAKGYWLYDGSVRREIVITARPAAHSQSRYDGNEQLDETRPIPVTPDGRVYLVGATGGGEFGTLAEAKAWADSQPWGPVQWLDEHE